LISRGKELNYAKTENAQRHERSCEDQKKWRGGNAKSWRAPQTREKIGSKSTSADDLRGGDREKCEKFENGHGRVNFAKNRSGGFREGF